MIDPAGNFFGTTQHGAAIDGCCGTVFTMKLSGRGEHLLYNFANNPEGGGPNGLLPVADGFVGTTVFGGDNCGTVFKLTAPAAPGEPWTESVIHTFASRQRRMQPVRRPGK